MTKQEIINQYNRLHNRDKKTVTGTALEYLENMGISVGRSALNYWRYNDMTSSPLKQIYLNAYIHAFQQFEQQPEAAQTA